MIEPIKCHEIVSVFRTQKKKILIHSTRSISNMFAILKLEFSWAWAILSILAPPTKLASPPPSWESILDLTCHIKTSNIADSKASDKYSTLTFPQQINSLIKLGPAQLILYLPSSPSTQAKLVWASYIPNCWPSTCPFTRPPGKVSSQATNQSTELKFGKFTIFRW